MRHEVTHFLEKDRRFNAFVLGGLVVSLLGVGGAANSINPVYVPSIDDAPLDLAAEKRWHERNNYKSRVVQQSCPELRNGHPDDLFDICYLSLPPQKKETILEKLGEYQP